MAHAGADRRTSRIDAILCDVTVEHGDLEQQLFGFFLAQQELSALFAKRVEALGCRI